MALSYDTLPGDIDHLIADDHAVVERQFQHLEAGRGDRAALVHQVALELAQHAFAEETVLYPAFAEAGMAEDATEGRDEHREMKEALAVLDRTEPGDPEFEPALADLIREVRHHAPEEEAEMLPGFRRRVGAARMAELGADFLAAKRRAPTRPHPEAPDTGLAEKVAGALAAPLDHLRDKVTGRSKQRGGDPSGLLDPQAQALADAWADLEPLPQEVLTPDLARRQPGPDAAVRRLLEQRGESTDPQPVGEVADLTLPGPGGDLPARVYRPEGFGPVPLPVLVWVHGGGWVLHDLDTVDGSCRGLTTRTGAIVVSVGYRHAPEHPFPAAHDDVAAAYAWVVANAARLGGDPERIALGGESVGATMAFATTVARKRARRSLPVEQVLVHPLTTPAQYGESMTDSADARPLTRPLLSWLLLHAVDGTPEALADWRLDLLSLPSATLCGLPPTLVIGAGRDVLRSQGEEFARRLDAAGVDVTLSRYEGVAHDFFAAAAVLDKAAAAQDEAAAHLRTAYGP